MHQIKYPILLRLFSLFILLFAGSAYATHNRAGEITYRQISALQYEFTLTTFTEFGNNNADRPSAILSFGDGTFEERPRIEQTVVAESIYRNKYRFTHTFPGYDAYTISYQDPNRNFNVLNITNSGNTPFYIETFLVINPFIGFNSSPTLLLEPIDFGGVNKLFVHNPNAFDVDGDSLSFKLVACKQDVNKEVPNYRFPTPQEGFATISFDIDQETGQVVWRNPKQIGLYNIAILIEEWRFIAGLKRFELIGYVIRDMQITIVETDNNPPVIAEIKDTCILAGTELIREIVATDIDGDYITLTATGGPFKLAQPDSATFPQPTSQFDTVRQTFRWKPTCVPVRKQPYQVVFKAIDNGDPKLVDLRAWRITVVAPAPENLTANAIGNSIQLNWDPYSCPKAVGYRIYRRSGSFPFTPGPCETGLPPFTGYQLIKVINDLSATSFMDDNNGNGLAIGNDYCYRIVGVFPDGAESFASNEACDILTKDLPALTHVSILTTNTTTGTDSVKWSKPTDIDTTQLQPPYTYKLYRATSANPNYVLLATFTSPTYAGFNDTTYKDTGLNTKDDQLTYKVEFYASDLNGPFLVGTSQPATSVFTVPVPGDNAITLNFNVSVPWTIDSFEVYRYNTTLGSYQKIGASPTNSYTDSGLANGFEFCYYVRSIGHYSAPGFESPLINRSQEVCATPVDMEKPCPPVLTVVPDCKIFQNSLSWSNPETGCADDVLKYRLYKAAFVGEEFILIEEKSTPDDTTHKDIDLVESIAGCYFVTSIDSFNNESDRSNVVCVDNCPLFSLPNTFTPNGDGKNDFFIPFTDSLRFIKNVDFQVFNRWGDLVFKTTNPEIKWDGKHYRTHILLPSGVYFYTVDVFEIYVEGIRKRQLSGTIHLFSD